MQLRLFVLILLAIVLSACSDAQTTNQNQNTSSAKESGKEKEKPPIPQTLDEALNHSIGSDIKATPLSDGGAYVVTEYGVWYLKEGVAKRVTESSGVVAKQPKEAK